MAWATSASGRQTAPQQNAGTIDRNALRAPAIIFTTPAVGKPRSADFNSFSARPTRCGLPQLSHHTCGGQAAFRRFQQFFSPPHALRASRNYSTTPAVGKPRSADFSGFSASPTRCRLLRLFYHIWKRLSTCAHRSFQNILASALSLFFCRSTKGSSCISVIQGQ